MIEKNMKYILIISIMITIFCFSYCSQENESKGIPGKKVLVLGIDGMDFILLSSFMEQGKLPTFSKLSRQGCFHELGTSTPPQSPVAWSNFITGKNPGGHGIFDFIHRIPDTLEPYLSTSISEEPPERVKFGFLSLKNRFSIPFTEYHLPYSAGSIKLMREGKAFWEFLDDAGIENTIFKIPSNYPPIESGTRTISGMGTPDIQGTYGNFSFYSNTASEMKQEIAGGHIYEIEVLDNQVKAELYGPPNTFIDDLPQLTIPFTVYIDTDGLVGKIVLQDSEILLKQGEWSNWVQLDFEPIPYIQSLNGICKFYLKEVYPDFKLYVTPINIDPSNPALPISQPPEYAQELFENIGFYYTQGMAEDTMALANGVLNNEEYLTQSEFVFTERMKMYNYELERFRKMETGLLFFYFSTLDQNTHVFWRTMDTKSPAFNMERDQNFTTVMEKMYQKMDGVLKHTMESIPDDTTLIVMSDHGFSPFYRSFQLNSWLLENGYITLKDPAKRSEIQMLSFVDWEKTRAYALGLNGLYLNIHGREPNGIVQGGNERESLIQDLIFKLKNIQDPENDEYVILDMYRTDKEYTGPYKNMAPDLIVGYNRGYRSAWESSLGEFPTELIADNTNAWSGDHCMSPEVVKGIFLSNKKSRIINPKLQDMAPTFIKEFGLPVPEDMTGQPVF